MHENRHQASSTASHLQYLPLPSQTMLRSTFAVLNVKPTSLCHISFFVILSTYDHAPK